ncbi:LPXTG cell wall anchor domain-containing protein [Kitasatospora sp. NPDC059648]|uniref:LPXTG cell wall anchor domain-containing protein n=1 Tax=Kitasatospora sp. NPDC059648 TaxID=3346894 RepID=UPI0036CBA49E
MRPARLPAACTLLVLTIGPVALATAPALAADATPTGPPSATSTATGSPGAECPEGTTADPIPVTSSSDDAGELAVTFTNPATATVKQLATTVASADGAGLPVELRAGSGAWKPLTVTGTPVNAGSYQLPQGQRLTLRVRLAGGAPHGDHRLTFTAKSEVLPSGSAPAKKYTCPQLAATYTIPLTPTDRLPAPTHLADTGAGTATRPLAIAGTTALLLGAALLLVTRRRPLTD